MATCNNNHFVIALEMLSDDYGGSFVDLPKYSGSVSRHLVGLASVIEHCSKEWRPRISELLELLPESEETNRLVSSGLAFGVAKTIGEDFPGPAILLFGAALNTIGSEPNTDLRKSISSSEKLLKDYNLLSNSDIRITLEAAKERAKFDKVTQMLRYEFKQGIIDSGEEVSDIDNIVNNIVNITHDVRHKGLIERLSWIDNSNGFPVSSTDISYFHKNSEVRFVDDKLRGLLPLAKLGCAFSIYRRLYIRKIGIYLNVNY